MYVIHTKGNWSHGHTQFALHGNCDDMDGCVNSVCSHTSSGSINNPVVTTAYGGLEVLAQFASQIWLIDRESGCDGW